MFKFKLSSVVIASGALFMCLSAQATPVTFTALLSGAAEVPPNASLGTGLARVIFDTVLHTMKVSLTFSGLTGTTQAGHIHCCIAAPGNVGVATGFAGFPTGLTSGTYSNTFDMTLTSSYTAGFISANGGTATSAEQALFNGTLAGKSYVNLHTSAFPGGEIRGFLSQVPEPGSLALVLLALGGIGLTARVRSSRPG